jgi:hypothetical protein
MNHLRPEIPARSVALVNVLVKPLDGNIDGLGAVLLDQLTRNPFYARGHSISSVRSLR